MIELSTSDIVEYGVRGTMKCEERPVDEGSVPRVEAWIRSNCKPTKTVRRRVSSYGWKHVAEDAIGEYVSNGAFIVAAIRAGYRAIQAEASSPNVCFNMVRT